MTDTERTPLPSHAPGCFGCGPNNPCGLGLHAWRDGRRCAAMWSSQSTIRERRGSPTAGP